MSTTALLVQFPGGVELFIFALVLLFSLGSLIVWLGLTYWVYQDARERRVGSPAVWAAVVFFVGPVGAVIYLLVRDEQ